MIELIDIRKSYRIGPVEVEVLKGISLKIKAGDMMSVVGASGCGKSTLMNILGLLDLSDSGQYLFEGKETAEQDDKHLSAIRNNRIGFVFQQFFLLSRLTALENVCLPLIYRGISDHDRKKKARAMLDKVGLLDKAHHKPTELSGGQQQRVAIARALSGDPAMILADEPTGALDTKVGQDVMDLFIQLNQEEHRTIIIITHDMKIAKQCPRQIRMRDGLIDEGTHAPDE